jgi:CheY-like chemotaxis protein
MANELILIVEDNPKNLKLVRDTLQVKGYQTISIRQLLTTVREILDKP